MIETVLAALAGASFGALLMFRFVAVPERRALRAEEQRVREVVTTAKAEMEVRRMAERFVRRFDEQERMGKQCPHLRDGPRVALNSLRTALDHANSVDMERQRQRAARRERAGVGPP